jgi:hypothetical protein
VVASADQGKALVEHAGATDKNFQLYEGLFHDLFREPRRSEVSARRRPRAATTNPAARPSPSSCARHSGPDHSGADGAAGSAPQRWGLAVADRRELTGPVARLRAGPRCSWGDSYWFSVRRRMEIQVVADHVVARLPRACQRAKGTSLVMVWIASRSPGGPFGTPPATRCATPIHRTHSSLASLSSWHSSRCRSLRAVLACPHGRRVIGSSG